SLASWSIKSNLHYHILINTKLSIDELYDKSKYLINDRKKGLQEVTNKEGLQVYFAKDNLNDDIIALLKADTIAVLDDEELKLKKIEILKHGKIINHSINLNKPIIKKYDGSIKISDIEELKGTRYIETKDIKTGTSNIQIDKFKKIDDDDIKLNNKLNKIFE
ncbi:hypothetical protein ACLD44_19170, partial [Clostridium botulinum]